VFGKMYKGEACYIAAYMTLCEWSSSPAELYDLGSGSWLESCHEHMIDQLKSYRHYHLRKRPTCVADEAF